MTTPATTKTAAFENYPATNLLTRASAAGVSLAAGASQTWDVLVGGTDWITVMADLASATTTDLVVTVKAYTSDGTLSNLVIAPDHSVGPTAASGHTRYQATYNVSGYDKVQIAITNASAGTLTLTSASWRTEGY